MLYFAAWTGISAAHTTLAKMASGKLIVINFAEHTTTAKSTQTRQRVLQQQR